jgi:hypothetical protein
MKVEFDDGTILRVDEKQDNWLFSVIRGKGQWINYQITTLSDESKKIDRIKVGSEWANATFYSTGGAGGRY